MLCGLSSGLSVALPAVAWAQTDEPAIISDDDFDQALEPLEQFDLTLPDEPATETEVPSPAPLPVINPNDQTDGPPQGTETNPETNPETIPVTALEPEAQLEPDAELNTPLPPLEGFDVVPLQAAAATDAEDTTLQYHIQVDGIDDRPLFNRFKALSALYQGSGRTANSGMLNARIRQDEDLIIRLLKADGYYDAQVRARIEPIPDRTDQVQVRLHVITGKPYHFGDVRILAAEGAPIDLIRSALTLSRGERIEAERVLRAEANIRLTLPQQGYPFVEVGLRDISLDPATALGDYTLPVTAGPHSVFGTLRSEAAPGQSLVFDDRHVGVLARFEPGEVYDNREVDDLRQALATTGLFRSVSVEPVRTGRLSPEGSEIVDLRVVQAPGPARALTAEAGYSTGQGLTLKGSWGHRNLFPPEGALNLGATLGTQEQALALIFRRSNFRKRDRTLTVGAGYFHNNYDSYEAFTTGLQASLAHVSTPIWQKEWSWSLGIELLSTRESSFDAASGLTVFETYQLVTVPTLVLWDRSDDLLDPTQGFRLAGQVTPQISLREDQSSSLRLQMDASIYHRLSDSMVLAARTRIGSVYGADLFDIAPSRRIYGGGGGSVRGFSYQALGPLDINDDPTGGLSVFEAAIELRYRFQGDGIWSDLGVVPFVDIGQVYLDSTPGLSDMRVGIGVGVRYYTTFGPIRVDIATPLSRRDYESPLTLYVGIGQAF